MSVRRAFVPTVATLSRRHDMFQNPMDYLKANAIAFLAGALTILAVQAYDKIRANW